MSPGLPPRACEGVMVVAAAGAFQSVLGSGAGEHTYSTGTAETRRAVLCGCTRTLKVTRDAGQSPETVSVVATRDRVFPAPREAADAGSALPRKVPTTGSCGPSIVGRSLEDGTHAVRSTSPGKPVQGSLGTFPSCPSFLCSFQQKFEFLLCARCQAPC